MPTVRPSPCSLLAPGAAVARHGHAQAYASVVLQGGYQEAGDGGRWDVAAGDVLVHAPFSAHCDRASATGARVLNIALPRSIARSARGAAADIDQVIRLAARDPREAAEALMRGWREGGPGWVDAPDLLARTLCGPEANGLALWASTAGVSRATAFRWFRLAYGVAPTTYRIECRARAAWRLIVDSPDGLADIAVAAGYADQPHMNRDVRSLTGRSPGAWRSAATLQHSSKTREAGADILGA